MASWVERKAYYEAIVKGIDSSVILTTKDSWVWKTIATILLVFTFGRFKREVFLQQFATAIGPVHAFPKEWTVLLF